MNEEEMHDLIDAAQCEGRYEDEHGLDGERCKKAAISIHQEGFKGVYYFCEKHLQEYIFAGHEGLCEVTREIRDLTITKTIPFALNTARRAKSNEKKLAIIEKKLNVIYEMMIQED